MIRSIMSYFSSPSEDTDSEELLPLKTPNGYQEIPEDVSSEDPDNSESISVSDTESDSGSDPGRPSSSSVSGYVMAVLTVLGNAAGFACTQALNQSVPHSELNGLRFLSQFILTVPLLAMFNKCDVRVKTKSKMDFVWVALASACLTTTNYAFYGSAYYLPLGVALGIIESLILTLNFVVASILLREVRWCELLMTVICLIGVVVVVQPDALFPGSSIANTNETVVYTNKGMCHHSPLLSNISNVSSSAITEAEDEETGTMIGYILCIGGATVYAFYMQLVNRKLPAINMFVFSFWSCLFGTVSSFCIMAFSETPYFPTSPVCIAILFTHITAAGLASIMNYRVFQLLNPIIASLIRTLRLPLCFLLQYTAILGLFPGKQNPTAIVGAVMVFLGNALIPVYSLVQGRCKRK